MKNRNGKEMLYWDYRIIEHDEKAGTNRWFGLHEVFYDKNGRIDCFTEKPIIEGDSFDDILNELTHMVNDLRNKKPILLMTEISKPAKSKR
ncbi:MAG: hypothetical protein QUS13_01515 [Smithella sp.]|nr:hypothetical protein [Smithella sp.]